MRLERFMWGPNDPLIFHDDVSDAGPSDEPRDPQGRWTSEGGGGAVYAEQRGDKVVVYHGTSKDAVDAIKQQGLKPKGGKGADEWLAMQGMKNSYEEFMAGDRKFNVYFATSRGTALSFAQLAAQVHKSKPAVFEIALPIEEARKVRWDEGGEPGMLKYKGEIKPEWLKEIEIPPHIIEALEGSPPLMEVAHRSTGERVTDADAKHIYAIVFEDATPGSGRPD